MTAWVKCTDSQERTIFLNLDAAIGMFPLERTGLTRITFIGAEKDTVEVKEKSRELPLVLEAVALAERDVPDYIEADHSKLTAKMTRIPLLTDVPYAVQMEPHLVVEYYSR